MLITIQTITDSAIDLADMRRSAFIDQSGTASSELIRYVNMAYKDVYQQIVQSKENYFAEPHTFNLVGAQGTYTLPTNFYKLNGVDLALDNSNTRFITLSPAMFKDRNKYKSSINALTAPYGQVFRYLLIKDTIQFIPVPTSAFQVIVWYTPEPATITSLSDTVTLPPGCDEYMSLYIGAMMKAKEESDPSALDFKRNQVLLQLKSSLRERDTGSANYVVDEESINLGAILPFRGFY